MKRGLSFWNVFLLILLFPVMVGAQSGPTVVLTFDDATASQRTVVAPLLQRYGFGATFFVCEFPGFENKTQYMTWEQIRQLSDMGFEIGNHTRSHGAMSQQTPEQITEEIAYIEERCRQEGIPQPVTFAYPGYNFSEEGIAILQKRGYRYARHGGDKPYVAGTDPWMVPSYAIHEKDDRTLDFLRSILDTMTAQDTVVLCFHGVPDLAHDWVTTTPRHFKAMMKYLRRRDCRVIALRDL